MFLKFAGQRLRDRWDLENCHSARWPFTGIRNNALMDSALPLYLQRICLFASSVLDRMQPIARLNISALQLQFWKHDPDFESGRCDRVCASVCWLNGL